MNAKVLGKGSIIRAHFSSSSGAYDAGMHYAMVLSEQEEIAGSGIVRVAVISTNQTIAQKQDLVEVHPSLRLPQKCFVQCSWLEKISINDIESIHDRRAYSTFLVKVEKAVIAYERRIAHP